MRWAVFSSVANAANMACVYSDAGRIATVMLVTLPAIRCDVWNATVRFSKASVRKGVHDVELLLWDAKDCGPGVAQDAQVLLDSSRPPVALLGQQEDAAEVGRQRSNVGPFRRPLATARCRQRRGWPRGY